jgi:hypothetical protein
MEGLKMTTATARKPATRSAKKQPRTEPKRRIRLDQFDGVVEAREKLGRLRQHQTNLEQQLADALAKAGRQAIGPAQLRLQAERLIEGKASDAAEDVRSQLGELRHEIAVAEEAVKVQSGRLDAEVQKASSEISLAVRPDHELIVARIDQLLGLLAEALAEEENFQRGLRRAGVQVQLPDAQLRVRFPDCGQREVSRGRAAWRQRLQLKGYLDGPPAEPAPPRPELPADFHRDNGKHRSPGDQQRRADLIRRMEAAQEDWDRRYGQPKQEA